MYCKPTFPPTRIHIHIYIYIYTHVKQASVLLPNCFTEKLDVNQKRYSYKK
jgi:hypothetical protein